MLIFSLINLKERINFDMITRWFQFYWMELLTKPTYKFIECFFFLNLLSNSQNSLIIRWIKVSPVLHNTPWIAAHVEHMIKDQPDWTWSDIHNAWRGLALNISVDVQVKWMQVEASGTVGWVAWISDDWTLCETACL